MSKLWPVKMVASNFLHTTNI